MADIVVHSKAGNFDELYVDQGDGTYARKVATTGGGGGGAVAGDVAHDAVDSGNPVEIGGYADDNPPTAVGIGDRVRAWFKRTGEQVVWIANQLQVFITGAPHTAITHVTAASSSGSLIAARTARRGFFVFNTHATENAYIDTAATAASGTGLLLLARAGMFIPSIEAWSCIRAASTDVPLHVVEFYD